VTVPFELSTSVPFLVIKFGFLARSVDLSILVLIGNECKFVYVVDGSVDMYPSVVDGIEDIYDSVYPPRGTGWTGTG
jgi:hypothetical protein